MILNSVYETLYNNRVIRIDSEINSDIAGEVCSQLLAMDDDSHKPISLYINSPGGEVNAGLQIIDTMNSITSPVFTINVAMCASMGAVILSNGAKRMSLPHARVMIHQVSSGMEGNIQDMEVSFQETMRLNDITMGILAENCDKTLDEVKNDTNRDHWMYTEEAMSYGIIDEVTGESKRKTWKRENED